MRTLHVEQSVEFECSIGYTVRAVCQEAIEGDESIPYGTRVITEISDLEIIDDTGADVTTQFDCRWIRNEILDHYYDQ